jgi:UDP-N-acetylmuramate dehydrogenase
VASSAAEPRRGAALDQVAAALERLGARVARDAPLARRGWWRVGGPADLWAELATAEQLALALRRARDSGLPVTVVGNGSNLLVADAGVRGLAVKLTGEFRASSLEDGPDGPLMVAGAGAQNVVLIKRLDKHGLHGLGALAGVPGTLGGAVRMNAGTHLGELGDRVHAVELALPDGRLERLPGSALGFRYRWSELPPGAIVTRAWIRVSDEGVDEARAAVRDHLARRKATQPLDKPSCGSTFKNPPGDAAGRLIDAAGLKGHRIGGAQISEKHANFFLNTGEATAAELLSLVRHARRVVFERFGVVLEPEVHLAGDWPAESWPLPSLAG